jgi:dolichol-phosphate mannosyltransferase
MNSIPQPSQRVSSVQQLDDGTIIAPAGRLVIAPLDNAQPAPALSLIIPTLNEAENISEFLTQVRSTLDSVLPGRYEIIVVDDCSLDRTGEIAARLASGFAELRVVRRKNETGLARAVIRGWQVARGETLGTINADFQHPPAVLASMIARLPGADLVVATRHAEGGGLGDWGLVRRAASWGAAVIGRIVLPQVFARVSDPLSGCYMVRRQAIEGVELRPIGYKSLMELLVRGRIGPIRECGYEMRKRERGKSKVRAIQPFQFVSHVMRLRAAVRERAAK